MKYFTREWCNGRLNDEQYQKVKNSYRNYINRIYSKLPATIKKLLRQNGLHDSLFKSVLIDQRKNYLHIKFLSGDLQMGYFEFEIVYIGINLSNKIIDDLFRIFRNEKTEFLYDEIRMIEKNKFEHSMIFYPKGEVELTCKQITCGIVKKIKNREIKQRKFQVIV
ncbi:MAG: DUF4085 family protein [bacterium]|nr:DUF4085 family protein [bacterium]